MTVEVRLLGNLCNLECTYCYQESMRESKNKTPKKNMDAIIAQIEKAGSDFTLFGGEALLSPKEDLEYMWSYGFEKFGKNGIQTNGTLIDDDHIEMFKKYNVYVGISIDGPNELNILRKERRDKSDEKTLETTQVIMENIAKLRDNNINVGIIITLSRANATKDKLPRLINFIEWLASIGINGGNAHLLEIEETMPEQNKWVLDEEENNYAFLTLAEHMYGRPDLRWNPFMDKEKLLRADDYGTTCYHHNCDPLNTQAVHGINGDGQLSNCGRSNKEGIDWVKTQERSYMRYISLYQTPQEFGGCGGCRFWLMCGGGCPGEGKDADIRNKTSNCKTIQALYGFYEGKIEEKGEVPLSKSPMLPLLENMRVQQMLDNRNISVSDAVTAVETTNVTKIHLPVYDVEE